MVSIPIDAKWHEEYMIMMLLKDGPLTKARLKNELRTIQKKEFTPFQPHSDSAYNYWIKALKKRDILSEQNKILNDSYNTS